MLETSHRLRAFTLWPTSRKHAHGSPTQGPVPTTWAITSPKFDPKRGSGRVASICSNYRFSNHQSGSRSSGFKAHSLPLPQSLFISLSTNIIRARRPRYVARPRGERGRAERRKVWYDSSQAPPWIAINRKRVLLPKQRKQAVTQNRSDTITSACASHPARLLMYRPGCRTPPVFQKKCRSW